MTGTAYAINPQGPGTGDLMGQGKANWEAHKTFRLVRLIPGENYSGAIVTDPINYNVSAGSVMIWWTGTSGSDGVTVAPSARVTLDSRVAGVLVNNTVISSESTRNMQYATDDYGYSNWGYVQTYGKIYTIIGAAVSAGDLLGTAFAVTGGAAPWDILNASSTTGKATAGPADPARCGILGVALEADAGYSSGDYVNVIVKCE